MKNAIIAAVLALIATTAQAATCTHTSNTQSSASATNSLSSYSVTGGHELIVMFNAGGSATGASVADTLGNTWQTAFAWATASGNAHIAIFYAENVTGGTDTITVTMTGGTETSNMFIDDCTGLAASASFDKASTINGAFSTAVSTNSVTPAASGELAIMFVGTVSSTATFSAFTGGFTQEGTSGSPAATWADQTSTATAITGGATLSTTTNWSAVSVLFKPSGGGGGSCTHQGYSSGGALSVPNGTSGSYLGKTGAFVTPDCSTVQYWQPALGNFGTN